MRILVCKTDVVGEVDLALALETMGHEVHVLDTGVERIGREFSTVHLKQLSEELLRIKYNGVFTINFSPLVSNVCKIHHTKYISWTVDSPSFKLNSTVLGNECNYVFIFDYNLYKKFQNKSENVYYMPLGTHIEPWDAISYSKKEEEVLRADVSFVGSLYENKNKYDEVEMPDYLRGYLDGMIEAQSDIWSYNFLDETIPDEVIEEFWRCTRIADEIPGYECSKRDIVTTQYLGPKCSMLERHRIIGEVAKHFNLDLYTTSSTTSMPHVNNKGTADPRTITPRIFKYSKINLNITNKTIETGIPLRIYDIMGNHGFVLTNFRSELPEYFVPGEDLVIYENMNDLLEKIAYYLENEEERKRIAENGYKKVKELHTYKKRLEEMIKIVWQDEAEVYDAERLKSREKYTVLVSMFGQLQMHRILDAGLFLGYSDVRKPADLNDYQIDGVAIIDSLEKSKDSSIYNNIYEMSCLPEQFYDTVIIVDVLKYLDVKDLPIFLEQFRKLARVLLIDYKEEYVKVLTGIGDNKCQKLSAGGCEFLLITVLK